MSHSLSFRCPHARIWSIFVNTNNARWRFSLGSIGAVLVRKLIKQTKVDSWLADQPHIDQFLLTKAKSDVRASWCKGSEGNGCRYAQGNVRIQSVGLCFRQGDRTLPVAHP